MIQSGHYGWSRYYDTYGSYQGITKELLEIIQKLNWMFEQADQYITECFPAQAELLDKLQHDINKPFGGKLYRK
jgi:hypothetical protein